MCRPLGRIHLIALYHGEPLPLDAGKIQRRLLIGGYFTDAPRGPYAERAMAAIRDETIRVAPLITHHFPFTGAKAAFDLLYESPDAAFGVVLIWE
jgi:threonine dehydrogenase-like Zn-dependent dehydrogenase